MSIVVDIKITNTSVRFKRAVLQSICQLVIQNKIGHPEAPYRANYEAKFYSSKGTLVKTTRIEDFDRSRGAMQLVKEVLNQECPTHLQFQEADMLRLLDGAKGNVFESD